MPATLLDNPLSTSPADIRALLKTVLSGEPNELLQHARLQRRVDKEYLDTVVSNLDEAWSLVTAAREERRALSVGLVGNCADILPEMVRRGWIPDVVTDQTSAHDPLDGYVPAGVEDPAGLRERDPEAYVRRSRESIARPTSAPPAPPTRRPVVPLGLRQSVRPSAPRQVRP